MLNYVQHLERTNCYKTTAVQHDFRSDFFSAEKAGKSSLQPEFHSIILRCHVI